MGDFPAIVTPEHLDGVKPWAIVQAVAVLDGKVLSTGTVESMQPWLSHYEVTVDDTFKDKVSTTRPVYVLAWAPHFISLNTPALELSKIPTDSKDPHIQKYADGSLSGVLAETQDVVMGMTPVIGQLADAGGLKGLYFLAGVANRAGVTTVADLAFGALDWDAELKDHEDATSDPDFPLRIRLTPMGAPLFAKHGEKALDVVKDTQKHQTDRSPFLRRALLHE